MKSTLGILSFILTTTIFSYSQSNDWKFVKKIDGISIYHRKVGNGNLKDVKIETTFDSNLSTIVEALLDVPSFNKWIYKVEYSKTLRIIGPNQVEYHNRINMPWPAVDRDIVAINKISQNAVTKEVISEDVCNWKGLPLDKNFVRIKDFYAKWTLNVVNGGVKGTYIFHSDPGGDLPAAMVNLFIDEGPLNSIKGLKKMIALDKYKTRNSHGIVN
ncbi:START domain-containing protein [Lacihabitans soyangensis]|nr:START domain-containing protein [Lacihabitans soyangensis]